AVSPTGNVYVYDRGQTLVHEYGASGASVTQWALTGSGLTNPTVDNLTVDPNPPYNIYLTDGTADFVMVYSPNGSFAGHSSIVGPTLIPAGIVVIPSGYIYVVDQTSE